jgi:hypothetical protein
VFATVVGAGLDFVDFSAVKTLYWTGIINESLAASFSSQSCCLLRTRQLEGELSSRVEWALVAWISTPVESSEPARRGSLRNWFGSLNARTFQ